jgi:hypothetical protein
MYAKFCTEGDGCGQTLSKCQMFPTDELSRSLSIIRISFKPPNNSRIDGKCSFGQRFAAAIPLCAKLCIHELGDGLRPNFVQTPVKCSAWFYFSCCSLAKMYSCNVIFPCKNGAITKLKESAVFNSSQAASSPRTSPVS